MTRLPGVYPQIADNQLGMSAGIGADRRAIVGVCSAGEANQVYTLTNPSTATRLLGRGPLTDAVITQLSQGGGTVYAVPVAGSLAGQVTAAGTNADANVTLSGTAREALDVMVKITKAGAVGTAEFVYSLDGGDTFGPVTATSAEYALPGTPHRLVFAAGDYALGKIYRFDVSAPQASMTDVERALRVLLDSPRQFEYVHVAQPGDVALWTMLDVLAGEAEAQYRYPFFMAEAPAPTPGESADAWANRLLAMITPFVSNSKRVLIVASWGEVLTQDGLQQTRNWAAQFGARVSSSPVQENPGWVQRGRIPTVLVHAPFTEGDYGKASTYNNGHAQTLEAAGYTVAYTQAGLPGYYWVEGRMAVPAESDFSILPNRRVMDKAVTLARKALLPGVQETVDPADLQASLAHRLAKAQAPLNSMRMAGEISSGRVVIPPGQDVLSTRRLIVQVRVVPMGYTREIVMDIGFENPALLALPDASADTESGTSTATGLSGADSTEGGE